MDPTPSDLNIRRLYLIGKKLRRARELAKSPSPEPRMEASWLLDHVVELLAGEACDYLKLRASERRREEPSFWKTFDLLAGNCPGLDAHRRDLAKLHAARNMMQHQASIPSAEDLAFHAVACERFVRDTLLAVWHMDLEQIALGDPVSDQALHQVLERTDKAIAREDYREAMGGAAQTFDSVLYMLDPAPRSGGVVGYLLETFGRVVRDAARQLADQHPPDHVFHAIEEFTYQLAWEIMVWKEGDRCRDPMIPYELARIGVDVHDTSRFLQVLPPWKYECKLKHFPTPEEVKRGGRVAFTSSLVFLAPPDWNPRRDEALFVAEYARDVVRKALQWTRSFPRDIDSEPNMIQLFEIGNMPTQEPREDNE